MYQRKSQGIYECYVILIPMLILIMRTLILTLILTLAPTPILSLTPLIRVILTLVFTFRSLRSSKAFMDMISTHSEELIELMYANKGKNNERDRDYEG